jgi:predicted phosphate transport protein (TIGR00153 family)
MGIASTIEYFKPKEKKFFPLFEASAENLVKAAIQLNKYFLVKDKEEKEKIIIDIKEFEKAGDEITHELYHELNKTFITPFDREDINKLSGSLDDVMDMMNGFCQKMRNHPPQKESQYFLELSELILMATREIKIAILELKNLKYPKKIMEACIRINEIENQADDVYHISLSELFENEKDAVELIKTKEMLSVLEKATDRAEDVSDVLKSIIVKAG